MPPKFLRPLLVVEFLLAVQTVFTFWSQVGGQYHLDLMYWPWKFGVGIVAALLVTWITAALVRTDGAITGRIYVLGTLLLATIAIAGCVTYYYHITEPVDEDDPGDAQPTISRMIDRQGSAGESARKLQRFPAKPRASNIMWNPHPGHAALAAFCGCAGISPLVAAPQLCGAGASAQYHLNFRNRGQAKVGPAVPPVDFA